MDSFHPTLDLTAVDWSQTSKFPRASESDFVLLYVDTEKMLMRDFIEQVGSLNYSFKVEGAGNSYYEWKETLKELKQNVDIVVHDLEKNCFYVGNGIRNLLSLPNRGGDFWKADGRSDIYNFSPINVRGRDKYPIFISSTSVARRVKRGDRVLYRKTGLKD